MTSPDRQLPAQAAAIITAAFDRHVERFRDLTCHARAHFEARDWQAGQRNAAHRLDLYGETVSEALNELGALLGGGIADRPIWSAIRAEYARRIAGAGDEELNETWFNSVTRRVFHTIGVDPAVEFVVPAAAARISSPPAHLTVGFPNRGSLASTVREVLEHFRFAVDYDDAPGDAERVARAMEAHLGGRTVLDLEFARPVFFRGKGAYLAGLARTEGGRVPVLLALRNPEGRILVDAVLLTENEVSIVFSFARSYLLVELERPREMVDFLKTLMPRKPVAELYNALGYNKHGKTELYRSLLYHLASNDDRFEIAPGQRGMVMSVFTLPGFDVVFKVMRDRFEYPKTVTHQEVRDKYRLVFHHDRAGRLVDAQEFEHLAFDAHRFSEALLRELTTAASETVQRRGDKVVIAHLYTERRLLPLDLYLREADPESAREAVLDYGQALRDLAATNIFPGDMLLKNFGVSRHGRLIFYDYDELCPLSDCRFRQLPAPRSDDEETALEPWFYVSERDIFPEEFRSFLGLQGDLLETFLAAHGDLLGVEFWHRMQEMHRRGEVMDIYPYKAARRLRPETIDPLWRGFPFIARS
jgi:isocitrate dehydrogenase kinase/phosphatase